MQRILIVEDDVNQLNMLQTGIQQNYPVWEVDCASTLKEALNLLTVSLHTKQTYSLFLLDVQLAPDTTERGGFILASEIRKHTLYFTTPLLFLTSISDENQFALSNFHCYNYISKPYKIDDIIQQIEQMTLTGYLKETSLFVKDEFQISHNISIDSILFIESAGHIKTIYTSDAKITTRTGTMDSLEKVLGTGFCRCHKKCIVNLARIENYDATNRCITISKHTISVGRAYRNTFKEKWSCFSH